MKNLFAAAREHNKGRDAGHKVAFAKLATLATSDVTNAPKPSTPKL